MFEAEHKAVHIVLQLILTFLLSYSPLLDFRYCLDLLCSKRRAPATQQSPTLQIRDWMSPRWGRHYQIQTTRRSAQSMLVPICSLFWLHLHPPRLHLKHHPHHLFEYHQYLPQGQRIICWQLEQMLHQSMLQQNRRTVMMRILGISKVLEKTSMHWSPGCQFIP